MGKINDNTQHDKVTIHSNKLVDEIMKSPIQGGGSSPSAVHEEASQAKIDHLLLALKFKKLYSESERITTYTFDQPNQCFLVSRKWLDSFKDWIKY